MIVGCIPLIIMEIIVPPLGPQLRTRLIVQMVFSFIALLLAAILAILLSLNQGDAATAVPEDIRASDPEDVFRRLDMLIESVELREACGASTGDAKIPVNLGAYMQSSRRLICNLER